MKRFPIVRLLLAVVLISLVVLPLGCKKKEAQAKDIKIGATLPLSGDAAVWGNNTKEGIELALKEINNAGGALGKKIEVIYEDTQALPDKGVSAYRKLTQIDKVTAIIDDSVSSVTLAMAPLAQKDHVVILATGATAPKISDAGEYIFRIWNSDSYEGEVAADYAFDTLKLQSVAILYINNDYGKGLENVFRTEFIKRGGKIVASESFEQNSTDMRTSISKIKGANVDGLYLVGYPKEIPIALKQAKELGLKASLIGTVAMNDPKLLEVAGEAAERLMFPYPEEVSGKEVGHFKEAFKKTYGKEPGITADVGFDAVKMIARAISFSRGASGDDIRKGLNSLKDYEGASGVMTFDEKGDVHKPMGIQRVEGQKFQWVQFLVYEK
jgi:branched-chain amino acid transport system substrate-binding protein